ITEVAPGTVQTGFAEARHRGDRARADAFYAELPAALTPDDVANAVLFAIDQPPHVNIGQILITPTLDK
ncbi:MAG: SDR family NAD(P)-dependent oxidoreductase, partial [Chromatiales bacterium]|nr:SDR family NAD(P)-dependent oxidoreductase [Chromatiales bacterium]